MVNIDYLNNISFNRGDTVNLYIQCNDYDFKEGDSLKLIVEKESELIIEKTFTTVENNIIYIELTSSETKDMPLGDYNYSLFAFYEKDLVSCVIDNNNLTIKEGLN